MYSDFKVYRKKALTKARQMDVDFQVATTEGVMSAKSGDYLCVDCKGNLYPCDKEVFEQSYEEVKEDSNV